VTTGSRTRARRPPGSILSDFHGHGLLMQTLLAVGSSKTGQINLSEATTSVYKVNKLQASYENIKNIFFNESLPFYQWIPASVFNLFG
jgi:hypothetical protein